MNASTASADENASLSTVQNSIDDPIEIVNSADEGDGVESEVLAIINTNGSQTTSNETHESKHDVDNSNVENNEDDLNSQNGTEVNVKSENPANGTMEFNLNTDNGGFYVEDSGMDAESLYGHNQPSTSSSARTQSKCDNEIANNSKNLHSSMYYFS